MEADPGRFGAVDVHYPASGGARAALVVAADRRFAGLVERHVLPVARVAEYRPGRFYERELPPLLAVLDRTGPLDLVIVDGYVDLDPAGHPGLGAHLYRRVAVPVIGVAKSAFRSATHAVPVRRGGATRPLYVTAARPAHRRGGPPGGGDGRGVPDPRRAAHRRCPGPRRLTRRLLAHAG